MTRNSLRSALLASACTVFVGLSAAGCATGTNSHHGKDNAQGPRQPGNELALSRDPDSLAYNGNGTASNNRSSTYYSGTTTSTVRTPATTTVMVPATTTSTVLVPTTTTTMSTVIVPAGSVGNTGATVYVPANQVPASYVVGSDIDFMATASQFNATEITLSQIAYQRAQSADVRRFALETITAHRRMLSELDGVALRRNISLAYSPNAAGNAAANRLSMLSGWDVDRAYLDQIIADHRSAVSLYQAESYQAADVTLRSSAGGDAVDINNRLDRASRLRYQVN